MVIINGKKLYEVPGSCGTCPFLITGNTNSQKALQERDAEIERLKATNEKLVLANGNLLKQIPVEKANTKRSDEDASEVKTIKLSDAFDANGNFKH